MFPRQIPAVDMLVAVHKDVTAAHHVGVGLLGHDALRVAAKRLLLVLDIERLVRLLPVDQLRVLNALQIWKPLLPSKAAIAGLGHLHHWRHLWLAPLETRIVALVGPLLLLRQ